jgi:hypothetical protein
MSTNKPNRRFHWLTAAVFGALAVFATAIPLTPANAFVGVDLGGVGVGIGGHHGHRGHYANYGRGHYRHDYR